VVVFYNGNPLRFQMGTFRYSASGNYQAIAIAKVVHFLTYKKDLATTLPESSNYGIKDLTS